MQSSKLNLSQELCSIFACLFYLVTAEVVNVIIKGKSGKKIQHTEVMSTRLDFLFPYAAFYVELLSENLPQCKEKQN